MYIVNQALGQVSDNLLSSLESILGGRVLVYHGDIDNRFVAEVQGVLEQHGKGKKLFILLTTWGGSIEAVERLNTVVRHFYDHICFIIPDMAMSAGTIWALTGNSVMMNYASVLGPIDPQIHNGKKWVPATGYLLKVEELVSKAATQPLTTPELIWLQELDLAELARYEKARDLSVAILKQGLALYKFSSWTHHRSSANLVGKEVTVEQKEARAQEIASQLADFSRWLTHSRMIGLETLRGELRLEIDEYEVDAQLGRAIKLTQDFTVQLLQQRGSESVILTVSKDN